MDSFYGDLAGQAGSDSESQVSDVDPAQVAKMLEGLDDLDADLFGSTLKKKEGKSPKKQVKSALKSPSLEDTTEKHKSRVTFQYKEKSPSASKTKVGKSVNYGDFDEDDPLGDLLSDEESVETRKDISGKSKESDTRRPDYGNVKQQPSSINLSPLNGEKAKKAKVIADLFGLEDKEETTHKVTSSNSLSSDTKGQTSPKNKSAGSKSDDWLGLSTREHSEHIKPDVKKQLHLSELNSSVPSKSDTKNSEERLAGTSNTKVKSSAKTAQHKSESVKFEEDDDDLLGGMGFDSDRKSGRGDSGRSKIGSSKPKSIMDELLGKDSSVHEKNLSMTSDSKKSVAKPELAQDASVSFGSYSPSIPATRESRRSGSRRPIADPLGIFSPPVTPQRHSRQDVSETSMKAGAKSDWLGLSGKEDRLQSSSAQSPLSPAFRRSSLTSEVIDGSSLDFVSPSGQLVSSSPAHMTSQQRRESVIAADSSLPEWLGGTGRANPAVETKKESAPPTVSAHQVQQDLGRAHTQVSLQPPISERDLSLLVGSQLEQQAAVSLQHQESQLLAALRLQQHETHLTAMRQRQQVLLEAQENQLQDLLNRQQERQHQLEVHLKLQQERISGHVQALLSQPTMMPVTSLPDMSAVRPKTPEAPENKEHMTETQIALQRCELEKSYLECTLDKIQSKHQEEIQLLEDSYKRQIQILEESLEKQNKRLRAENERLELDYQEQVRRMQEQHSALVIQHGQQMTALQQERLTDLQLLRQQQAAMLDHIKQAQAAEATIVSDASSHTTLLQATLQQLGRSTGDLSELQGRVDNQHRTQLDAREVALKAKEAELQVVRESLSKQREATEQERKHLLGLVTQLELKLSEQRQVVEEERWGLRQEAARLEVKTQSFDRERERSLAQIERERQDVQSAKQSILEEQQTEYLKLREEKLSLSAEKSRLETLARLQGTTSVDQVNVEQLRAEMDAAMNVALEAARRAEEEREKLREQQRQLDGKHRQLNDVELDLKARAQELESLSQTAAATREEGLQALAEARRLDQQQSSRASDIQRQLTELRDREQRVAQEKLSLSQERVSLIKSKDRRLCHYCRGSMEQTPFSPDQSLAHSMPLPDKSHQFVDPKVVILKLIAEKDREGLGNNTELRISSLHSAMK